MKRIADHNDKTIHTVKRRIYGDMAAYRKKHGLGCFRDISQATGGHVAPFTIIHMYTGTKVNNDIWLEVGRALERLRGKTS